MSREDTSVIAGLLEKRTQVETAFAELERQIRVRPLEIAQLDATICIFAPSVIAAKREATRFKRSAHFLTGELTRLCLDCLRHAEGRPITATEVAVTALDQKGLDSGDFELRADLDAQPHARSRCRDEAGLWRFRLGGQRRETRRFFV